MKLSLTYGLLTAGPLSRILPVRFPQVANTVGPVMSPTLRLSSRAANRLRAGTVARNWRDFENCNVYLVTGVAARLSRMLRDMAALRPNWRGHAFLLDNPPSELQAQVEETFPGAATAAIFTIPPALFLLEGDLAAVKAARAILSSEAAQIFALRRSTTPLFAVGVQCLRLNVAPLLEAALLSLRRTGLPSNHAERVVKMVTDQAIRSYWKGGRRSFQEPSTTFERDTTLAHLAALEAVDPKNAAYQRRVLAASLEMMGSNGSWVEREKAKSPQSQHLK